MEWESEFERIPKDEESSETAEEMKSLKKSLEEKDDMENKLIEGWQELKAAGRELPAGRTEREGLLGWANRLQITALVNRVTREFNASSLEDGGGQEEGPL